MTTKETVKKEKLIAILRGIPVKKICLLADALHKGGINLIEVTFDPKSPDNFETTESIKLIKEMFHGAVGVGAGTVLTVEQVHKAKEAGTEYIISPNTNEAVIRETKKLGMISIPGALTPTEIEAAHEYGADFVKVFPVSSLGVPYLKAVAAPLSHIDLIAVGGVSPENIKDYLKAGACGVGASGSMVNKEWLQNGELEKITACAKEYADAVRMA